jgi:hypothetical protein
MRVAVAVLFALVVLLGFRVFQLEADLKQASRNSAIAVLSAEAANDKIGAFAPYFAPDKDKFIRAWLDSTNMPLAIFSDEVLVPIKRELESRRSSQEARQLRAALFK